MSRIITIRFRDGPCEIEIQHDYGREPDTGYHEVDWAFYDLSPDECRALKLTTREEHDIYQQVYDHLAEEPF